MEGKDGQLRRAVPEFHLLGDLVALQLIGGGPQLGGIELKQELFGAAVHQGGEQDLALAVQEAGRSCLFRLEAFDIMADQIMQEGDAVFAPEGQEGAGKAGEGHRAAARDGGQLFEILHGGIIACQVRAASPSRSSG